MSSRRTALAPTRSSRSNTSDRLLVLAHRIAGLLLSLWAGSLVTVCAVAAPSAFAVLERQSAGKLAARLFLIATVIGIAVSTVVLMLNRFAGVTLSRSTLVVLLLGALAPLLSEVILGPLMQSARAAGDMARFGALHGVSALLFGLACVCAVLAVWFFSRPAA